MLLMAWKHGLVLSSAVKSAIAHLTVVFTSARRNAIHKIVTNLIVHDRQMLFYAAHAERHLCPGLTDSLPGLPARTPFPIARSHVGRPYLVGTHAL